MAHPVDQTQVGDAIDLGHDGFSLGPLACFEQFFDTREALCDVATGRGRTTRVERSQGQLRARFTDRLGSDNAYGHAQIDWFASSQVGPIALAADAQAKFTGHR